MTEIGFESGAVGTCPNNLSDLNGMALHDD